MKVVIIMATPCTEALGGGSEGHKRQRGGEGRKLCWKFATVSWSGGGEGWVLVGGRRHFDDDVYYIFAGD